ncbi:MAG: poly(A) polymerase [Gammaproteobacteria bacterium]|jgi:poly(A) polymerase|nr:poly(A) polymerase [Gammaproteobacteria bacterium]
MRITRKEHQISLSDINPNVLTILTSLQEAGHQAYLVGGSVRDLFLNLTPKDYDIATDARPEEIRAIFRNCRLIGKRFRLAHIFFGRDIFEVATFRANHPEDETPDARLSEAGMLLRDNIYGSLADDAWRRDFTVNALYFDNQDLSILDHTGGMRDLKGQVIRVLGDPAMRFKEDPVRMLRAIRLSAKLKFVIEEHASQEIIHNADRIRYASPARLFDEIIKLFYCGESLRSLHLFRTHHLFGKLFPQSDHTLVNHEKSEYFWSLIQKSCENTDARVQQKLSLNPAFLFAVLLWGPLQEKIKELQAEGHRPYQATQLAIHKVIRNQQAVINIPKRFTTIMQEIWNMQHPLEKYPNKKARSLFLRPRFRAAYDFLMLRMESGDSSLKPSVDWWTKYQSSPEAKLILSAHREGIKNGSKNVRKDGTEE